MITTPQYLCVCVEPYHDEGVGVIPEGREVKVRRTKFASNHMWGVKYDDDPTMAGLWWVTMTDEDFRRHFKIIKEI